ncbi:MAG: MFS transporter [Candidatus Eisenbacteria bacterium]|uniref:MFS transporter n=1 Tax=Eiseniibacteriota bacterium TaxID=2212470 RepID=A0A7Y2EC99_UNCEI|nr:MFS transporter [Candidatus Eisenbacteria bacterium]
MGSSSSSPNPKPRGALSWALYDLANTIYSMNVVSLFFVQWVTVDRGREDFWFSLFYGGSMLLVALTLPYLGLWSDRRGRRLPFLAIFTLVCVLATAALGPLTKATTTVGLVLALVAFALSNYAFQGGLVFYNSLLPSVSTKSTRGRISGFGVALGYLGSFLGMLLVVPLVEGKMPIFNWEPGFIEAGGRTAAFIPTAILVALFALPIFLRVKEAPATGGSKPSWNEAFRDLKAIVTDRERYPGVGWFLLANFFVLDAIHTAIVFMSVYAEKVVGLPDSAKATFFMLATIPAIFGSFFAGWLSDRIGPKRVFTVTVWLWVVVPIVIAVAVSPKVFYAMGIVVGLLLGTLWTVTRPFLLSLAPAGDEGRLFGVYAFCNKSAAVLGPQVWALTVFLGSSLGPAKYRLAIIVLAGVAAIGALILRKVPDPSKARTSN